MRSDSFLRSLACHFLKLCGVYQCALDLSRQLEEHEVVGWI